MTLITLVALTADLAADIHLGHRRPDWAADFPSEGDLIISGMICRRIAAGADYHPPTSEHPWSYYVITVDGCAVGGCGFKSAPDDENHVEIGYGIIESHQGRGIATEAVRQLAAIAHTAGATVVAETEEWNLASIQVLRKIGFEPWERPDETHLWWRLSPMNPGS